MMIDANADKKSFFTADVLILSNVNLGKKEQ